MMSKKGKITNPEKIINHLVGKLSQEELSKEEFFNKAMAGYEYLPLFLRLTLPEITFINLINEHKDLVIKTYEDYNS